MLRLRGGEELLSDNVTLIGWLVDYSVALILSNDLIGREESLSSLVASSLVSVLAPSPSKD
jgi:hypothetical protein